MSRVDQKSIAPLAEVFPSVSLPPKPSTTKVVDLELPKLPQSHSAPAASLSNAKVGYSFQLTPEGQLATLNRTDGSKLTCSYENGQVTLLNDRHPNGQMVTWTLDKKTQEWTANHPGLSSTSCPLKPDLHVAYSDREGKRHVIRPDGSHQVS